MKSGHVKSGDIVTLKGDMEREQAVIGAFITLEDSTRPGKEEAITAKFYGSSSINGVNHSKNIVPLISICSFQSS